MTQDSIFLNYEGDNWFNRNLKSIVNKSKHDIVLDMIRHYNIAPKTVLEIGSSNGYRLNEINRIYGSKCTAVEPSEFAIYDGKKRYPNIEFHRALASELPFDNNQKFDLVIINSVFHWIDRKNLFKSVYEIDRVLSDDGFLIIGDFLPDSPNKVNYHHIKDEQVWTYKQDYTKIFTCSNLYHLIGFMTGHYKTKELNPHTDGNNRISVSLLRKNYDNYTEIKL